MKVVGIQTIFRDVLLTNYGSFFQHYALRFILARMGCRSYRCESGRFRDELSTCIFVIRKIGMRVLSLFGLCNNPEALGIRQVLLRYCFIRDFRRLIGPIFENQNERTDLFLAGGDSVWCSNECKYYLLDRDGRVPRVSYAASASWDKGLLDTNWIQNIKEVVRTYKCIGVREITGVKAIQSICPRSRVEQVVDPVLLMTRNDILRVCDKKKSIFKEKTLLYYVVNIWQEPDLNLNVLEQVADILGCHLKIIGIQGGEDFIPAKYRVSPSPIQFLAMIRDADYFVTNSFHGIVFSLILCKKFAFIKQSGRRYGDQNCRQRDFLDMFALTCHMVSSHPSTDSLLGALRQNIDEVALNVRIENERRRSLDWLTEAVA